MRDSSQSVDVAPLHVWLIDAGLASMPEPELFDGFCQRLSAAGFPLSRGYLSLATLHPLLWASGVTWQGGRIIDTIDIAYGYETRPAWLSSPFRHMLESDIRRLHRRLRRIAANDR
jgi:adenylate cyclase